MTKFACFKTLAINLYEKNNAVYYFEVYLFVPEIFTFLKYANWPNDYVIHSTKF